MCFIRLDIIILFCSWCGVFLYHHIITAVNSFHPGLEYTWEISETSLAFNWRQQFMHTTNLQIHLVTCCIYPRIRHTSRIPYLFHSFSDFVVYVVTTLIFSKHKSVDKLGHPISVVYAGHHRAQQIDRQSALLTAEKESSDRIPFTLTFHPHRPRS